MKTLFGQFFTIVNPFESPAFYEWFEQIPNGKFIEPFAWSNNIIHMIHDMWKNLEWESFDIDPRTQNVQKRDTIRDFPDGFVACITNPPYLAKNRSTRLWLDSNYFGKYDDVYKNALSQCLTHVGFVAAIIPESFINSWLFRERLYSVCSIPYRLFDDTECPVCVAYWIPKYVTHTKFYIHKNYIGTIEELKKKNIQSKEKVPMTFNHPDGNIGLYGVDTIAKKSIRFCFGEELIQYEVRHSCRSITRIDIPSIRGQESWVIDYANRLLKEFRESTQDVFLTPFKGLRKDGGYRRRLDFMTARNILSLATLWK